MATGKGVPSCVSKNWPKASLSTAILMGSSGILKGSSDLGSSEEVRATSTLWALNSTTCKRRSHNSFQLACKRKRSISTWVSGKLRTKWSILRPSQIVPRTPCALPCAYGKAVRSAQLVPA